MNKSDFYGWQISLLGHYDGWDYGIWHCDPRSFVLLKPLNEEEYVMMSIGPELDDRAYPNKINGTLVWTYMRVDDEFNEIDKEEFDYLVRSIKKKKRNI